MDTIQQTTKVSVFALSELKGGLYIVEPSGDSDCIYNRFPGLAEIGYICVNKHGTTELKIVALDSYEIKYHYKQRIFLSIPYDASVSYIHYPAKEERGTWWSSHRTYSNGSHGIEIRKSSSTAVIFISNDIFRSLSVSEEINGSFVIGAFGIRVPVMNFIMDSDARTMYSGEQETNVNTVIRHFQCVPAKWPNVDMIDRFMTYDTRNHPPMVKDPKSGIVKAVIAMDPFYNAETSNVAKMAYRLFAESATKTVSGLKVSVCFNSLFGNVTTQAEFSSNAKWLASVLFGDAIKDWRVNSSFLEAVVNDSRFHGLKKAAIKRKQGGAFNKIMADLDFVEIDQKLYPKTHEAVHGGELPLGTFFRKDGETYFVYNDNWRLWEEMLTYHRAIAIEIAAEASRRTTYEKDLMSYFQFTLHTLPEYLARHTGKPWTGAPKLVTSANELDPPKEGENGTAKTRSALTPVVDNEASIVTVPYVSMSIPGRQTTYCYGLDYNVLQRGFSFKGNAISVDVEKELNGRDDYGLMFYTLTGSVQGRGYPTFLIIFERLVDSTRVHFHRTHPMRSKSGEYNPVHNWTKGCYKWMIGNVNFSRIKAQQGDLAFVQIDQFPNTDQPSQQVNSYDGHKFGRPVLFVPYTKKDNQNVLGYINVDDDIALSHNEHLPRIIPAGSYEIRQCRSWEANPKGIWSLRID